MVHLLNLLLMTLLSELIFYLLTGKLINILIVLGILLGICYDMISSYLTNNLIYPYLKHNKKSNLKHPLVFNNLYAEYP